MATLRIEITLDDGQIAAVERVGLDVRELHPDRQDRLIEFVRGALTHNFARKAGVYDSFAESFREARAILSDDEFFAMIEDMAPDHRARLVGAGVLAASRDAPGAASGEAAPE